MPLLLMLLVWKAVRRGHRLFATYAPSNIVAARVRAAAPTRCAGVLLVATTYLLLWSAHIISTFVANGGPGWVNIMVLALAWDAMKAFTLAAVIGIRTMRWWTVQTKARLRGPHAAEPVAAAERHRLRGNPDGA
jgi:hypothetical protein